MSEAEMPINMLINVDLCVYNQLHIRLHLQMRNVLLFAFE